MKKKIKFDFSKLNKATDETHPETLENKYKPVNTNSSASDKVDFLDSLAKDSRKDSFINILVKEALKANQMNNYKKKVSEINLKENDIEGLYDWSTLFNKSRPLSHYTRVNYKKIEEELDENNNFNEFKSPQILVDLPNDKMQYFFGKNSFGNITNTSKYKNNKKEKDKYNPFRRKNNSKNLEITSKTTPNINNDKNSNKIRKRNNKIPTWHIPFKNAEIFKTQKEESKSNNNINGYIQPVSIYANYGPNNTFYFSNTFSDYYKEDLKSFTKKMPVLKAKIKTNSRRLKTEIKKQIHRLLLLEEER